MATTEDLSLPEYDQLSLGDLRHRIRSLSESQLSALVEHEQAHGRRAPVLQVLDARLDELRGGAQPSGGDPTNSPPVAGTQHGSPVQQATAAEANTPLRHGVAYQTPNRGKP
jgi:hypothetical protein